MRDSPSYPLRDKDPAARPSPEGSLSVVIIGKNALPLLPDCLDSVKQSLAGMPHEVLYVDSHSLDESREWAAAQGVRVLVPEETRTSPALGRAIGTLAASGRYLLFLDHDMRLEPGFVQAALAAMEKGGFDGATGIRHDLYLREGEVVSENLNYFGVTGAREAPVFGGAILLSREALLRAGNWSPGVETEEEVELYARLKKAGLRVAELPVPMIRHLDVQRERRTLLGLLISRRRLGLGQAVVRALQAGSLIQLIRLKQAAFLTFGADILCLIALFIAGRAAAPWIVMIQALLLSMHVMKGQPRAYVTHTLLLIYLPLGMVLYRPRALGTQ